MQKRKIEALQIAVKRREGKTKREKERYTHLNAEFQRIARRDKKAFLSEQCKEIEENNRMGKTGGLFKKIRETKGTFHAKMGTIKDGNSKDQTEGEGVLLPSFHQLLILQLICNQPRYIFRRRSSAGFPVLQCSNRDTRMLRKLLT